MSKSLDAYRAKRDFSKTPEPAGKQPPAKSGNAYVIQKHAARRMHYDFRLELNGVLKSWAVPEGPSLIPNKKRLAVHVEDHPLEYGAFEGVIPEGEYGAGTVMVWDKGTWSPEFDPEFGYRKGHLKFRLNGKKLKGVWHLVRMAPKPREKQEAWLLFKSDDEAARHVDAPDILQDMPASAATGRSIEEIASDHDRVWSSRQGGEVAQPGQKKRKRSKPAVDPSSLPKAKPEKLPKFIEPMLSTAVEKAPSSADWVHEVKYDGYRVQVRIENGKVKLLTRKGLDWTERFTGVADAVAQLPVKSALIDAEVVVQTEAGVASFTALVDALKTGSGTLILYAFDLLHLDGYDVRAAPLKDRKAALAKILAAHGDTSRIRYSDHIEGEGDAVFRAAGRLGLEGIVSKRLSAPYQSGRSNSWVKIKATERGEFVIAGFVTSTVSKRAIGALVLGEHVGGKLVPSGHVGSGFSATDASNLWKLLDPMRTSTAPLKDETAVAKGAKWVEPRLVAEIEFRSRTGGELIRHATFREIVEGADPAKVVRKSGTATKRPAEAAPPVKLTNPGRLEWPEQGITKQGLADFYTEIADWILPHIADRPLSLVRCPGGVQEQCFFQKHKWAGLGDSVRLVKVPDEKEPMLALDSLAGLLELVQASVLEIHPWGAKADRPELPDRVTLDLDPGDNVPWQQVIDAALEVRARLSDLGLQSFVKTTGGKGLHVVFPLTPKADWDTVKRFAQSIAEQMAADEPRRYTANMAKKVRDGRIFVDYLRNGMGATAIAAYSTRARPGAAVSTPLAWDELGPGIRANHFTVENLPKRLPFLDRDPWEGLASLRQELPSARTSTRTAPAKAREPKGVLERQHPTAAARRRRASQGRAARLLEEGGEGRARLSRPPALAAGAPRRRQDLLSPGPLPARARRRAPAADRKARRRRKHPPLGRQPRGPAGPGRDRRGRAASVGLHRRRHRAARQPGVQLRAGRWGGLVLRLRHGARNARAAQGGRLGQLAQADRHRCACHGADRAGSRLGRGARLQREHRRAAGGDRAGPLRHHCNKGEAAGSPLSRLAAQRSRRHRDRRLFAARAARLSDRRAGQLARAGARHPARCLHDAEAAEAAAAGA